MDKQVANLINCKERRWIFYLLRYWGTSFLVLHSSY